MTRILATGGTHVGMLREGNEDALFVGRSVFAVADGMGGHLAGEVASETALEPVAALDERTFATSGEASDALRDAVVAANRLVVAKAQEDADYAGMGTTLTAALLDGRRLHIAHVGDSRAYLLRGERFTQLTDDHTLVQGLIDEGRITAAEAEVHPHRSVITRAIGVAPEVDVDVLTVDLAHGDRLLLCSDGLSGVVDDGTLGRALADAEAEDLASSVERLLALANAGGGPDNITAVLLAVDDPDAPPVQRRGTIVIDTRDAPREDAAWARDYVKLGAGGILATRERGRRLTGSVAPGGAVPVGRLRAGRLVGRTVGIVFSVALLLGLVLGGTRFLLERSFYVGVDEGELVIFSGVTFDLGPIPLSRVRERTGVLLEDIPEYVRPAYEAGRPAVDLTDARRMVESTPRSERTEDAADASP
ncbi:MAG: hypothetical protein RLZZ272_985 [Actinomycetota bacterium]|jgi:protein phosphatase